MPHWPNPVPKPAQVKPGPDVAGARVTVEVDQLAWLGRARLCAGDVFEGARCDDVCGES